MLFVFDMDNVLFDYDWRQRMAGLTAVTGHDLVELRRRWWHRDGEWAAEAGRWQRAEEYLDAFNAALGSELDPDAWITNRRSAMHVRPDSIAVVARAAVLGDVAVLTNNNAMFAAHWRRLVPELIPVVGDSFTTSSQYLSRKPEPLVFERMLEDFAVPAAEVFFTDDLPENVAGAVSVGITGHLFSGGAVPGARGLAAAVEQFAAARERARGPGDGVSADSPAPARMPSVGNRSPRPPFDERTGD